LCNRDFQVQREQGVGLNILVLEDGRMTA
jgi:hypothetical protein